MVIRNGKVKVAILTFGYDSWHSESVAAIKLGFGISAMSGGNRMH